MRPDQGFDFPEFVAYLSWRVKDMDAPPEALESFEATNPMYADVELAPVKGEPATAAPRRSAKGGATAKTSDGRAHAAP